MVSGEDNPKQEPGRGFAGLSSMLSDVDVPQTVNEGVPDDASGNPGNQRDAAKRAQSNRSPAPLPFDKAPKPSPASTAFKWVLGIAAGIGVLWFIGAVTQNSTYQSTTNSPTINAQSGTEPDSVSGEGSGTAPAAQAPSAVADSDQPTSPPARPSFDKPPAGRNLVLTVAQIRYCLAAGYMLDGAKAAVNQYNSADVDRFNGMVADYNSRCSQFRYQQGDLESARRGVSPYQDQLQAEGRRLFATNSDGSHTVQNAPVATIRNVQRGLNALGYNVGVADGVMGARTRSAIEAFQRAEGLVPDGRATSALLASMSASLAKTPTIGQQGGGGIPTSLSNTEPETPAPKATKFNRDANNYETCISGQYPYLCKHSLLTPDEATQVEAAERRANYQTCISGDYPYLCKHSLLTPGEATQVEVAERRANYQTCISGNYPYLCKHALLTPAEARRVAAAESAARGRSN